MKEKLTKLLDVKSIGTLLLDISFCYGFIAGKINAEQFLTIFTVVTGFYYGTQAMKGSK